VALRDALNAGRRRALILLLLWSVVLEFCAVGWLVLALRVSIVGGSLPGWAHPLPALGLPVFALLLRSMLSFYYSRRLARSNHRLGRLHAMKRQKLKDLKEIINYERVRELHNLVQTYETRMEKEVPAPHAFACPKTPPARQQSPRAHQADASSPPPTATQQAPPPLASIPSGLLHSANSPRAAASAAATTTTTTTVPAAIGNMSPRSVKYYRPAPRGLHTTGAPVAAGAAAPRGGGFLSWLAERFIGEEPQARAVPLICQNCSANNGVDVLSEQRSDFEFTCSSCRYVNRLSPSSQPPTPDASSSQQSRPAVGQDPTDNSAEPPTPTATTPLIRHRKP
jgi:hypothetical protein